MREGRDVSPVFSEEAESGGFGGVVIIFSHGVSRAN
jgi:hypothetical protein